MRAAIFHEPRRIEAGDRPDASLQEPTDAIVRVVVACVCGSARRSKRVTSIARPPRRG